MTVNRVILQELSLPLLGILLPLLSIFAALLYRIFFHPLSGIPGPFLAKCTFLWQNWGYWTGTWDENILALHDKYGPVVRISPSEVSFVDGEALKRIYGHVKPCIKVPAVHIVPFSNISDKVV